MASLNGQTIASSYEQLLHVDRDGGGNANTLVSVKDGDNGTTFGIKLATNKVEIIPGSNDANAFEVSQADGTAVFTVNTSTAGASVAGTLTASGQTFIGGTTDEGYSTLLNIEGAGGTDDVVGILFKNTSASNNEEIMSLLASQGSDSVGAINIKREGNADDAYIDFLTQANGGSMTEKMRIDSSGHVKLSNNGMRITMDSDTENANGSSLQRGTLFLNRDDTATIKQLNFYKAGSEHSYFETSSSGLEIGGANIGIGVTPDDEWDTFTAMQIGETGAIFAHPDGTGAGSAIHITANAYYDSRYEYLISESDEASRYTQENGKHLFYVAPAGTHGNPITFTEIIEAQSSQIKFSVPTFKLAETDGDANAGPIFILQRDNSASEDNNDVLGEIQFQGSDSANTTSNVYAQINAQIEDISHTSEDGRLHLQTQVAGTMTDTLVCNSGKVGIGINAPTTQLHVKNTTNNDAPLRVQGGTSTETFDLQVKGVASPAHYSAGIFSMEAANSGLAFYTRDSGGTSNERMVIKGDGKVAINDASPEGQLTIQQGTNDYFGISLKSSSDVDHGMTNLAETDTYGSISKVASDHGGFMAVGYTQEGIGLQFVADVTTQLSGQSTSSSGAIDIIAQLKSGVSATTLDADINLATIKNGSTTRFIFNSNGTGYADDSFSTFSDERLKKDIKEIPYGLDEINKLQPKIFTKHSGDFDNDGNVILEDNGKRKIGFIAQEIKKVIPEMITNPNEDLTKGFYALDDGKLTSVLVRAVQELSAKVTELEKKLGE